MEQPKPDRAILFANGTVTGPELRGLTPETFSRIIAADGGSTAALQHGFIPDTVVGDFDSITADVKIRLKNADWAHRPSQELCDLEKALILCLEAGLTDLTVVGFAGKRLDHTWANLSILARYDRRFRFTLLTPHARLYLVRDRIQLDTRPGQTVSLVPLLPVDTVTTNGLRYPLNGEPLAMAFREGTSNEATETEVSITISGGLLAVFVAY